MVSEYRGPDFASRDGRPRDCPLVSHHLASTRRLWRTHRICRSHILTHCCVVRRRPDRRPTERCRSVYGDVPVSLSVRTSF